MGVVSEFMVIFDPHISYKLSYYNKETKNMVI